MNKLRLFTISLIVIGFFVCIGYGVNTRKQWKNDVELRAALKKCEYTVEYSDVMEEESFESPAEVNSFDKLLESADVVVRVKVESGLKRTMYTDCTLTEAKVLDVYEGNVASSIIPIFEPSCVYSDFIGTVGSYNLMEDDTEYILFLKQIKCDLYGDGEYVYLPTTTSLSKYKCEGQQIVGMGFLREKDKEYMYSQVCSYDMATDDQMVVDFYNYNKTIIGELLNGDKIDEE